MRSKPLSGRVAIVTGAGRGLGRTHALALAEQGAQVVVNDLGSSLDGLDRDLSHSESVAGEITEAGGDAIVSGHDVADWSDAKALIALAVSQFGKLDILVNNAGILRDRTLAKMSESEWDAVIRVHLKGHAAPTHHAAAYWKERAKNGQQLDASVIMTSSASGLAGNFGQANYASAKAAVIALSSVVNLELGKYGVRSNVVAPAALTRMGSDDDGPEVGGLRPECVSSLVAWLASEQCPASGQVLQVHGRRIMAIEMASVSADLVAESDWSPELLDERLVPSLVTPPLLSDFFDASNPEGVPDD